MPRLRPRDILPTTVKNRNFGNIVLLSGTASASQSLANADSVVFTVTTFSSSAKYDADGNVIKSGQRILCIPDISLYVGSEAIANQLPGGTAVTESQWQVVFMGNDFAATDSFDTKTLVYVRNISAGTQTVLISTQSRVIVNSSAGT